MLHMGTLVARRRTQLAGEDPRSIDDARHAIREGNQQATQAGDEDDRRDRQLDDREQRSLRWCFHARQKSHAPNVGNTAFDPTCSPRQRAPVAATASFLNLTGVLERILFLNEENHYTIAEFRPDQGPADGAKKADLVTIVGPLPGVECGETLHLTGEWVHHSQHGEQFKVTAFRAELPSSVHGIRQYLGSGLVHGIGKVYARKIVDAFGTDTFRVLSEESARLREVPGIGGKRAQAIKRAWDDKRAERELYIFLQTYGVTPSQCVKLVQRYGWEAKPILQREPYRVAREIDGIGFRTADRIAINLGFANDAPPRLDAGLLFALDELQEEGHSAYPQGALVAYAAELLQANSTPLELRLQALLEARAIVRHGTGDDAIVQLPVLDRAEQKIADAVLRLSASGSSLPAIKIPAAIAWAEEKAGFTFAELQRAALHQALAAKFSVLTGGPGTGKTTILRALVEILQAKKARVHLAAPTGRAAQRLAAATGGYASTLHRLLKWDPTRGAFSANDQTPLSTDYLIVDESSMLDTRLAAALLQAIPSRAHLLLVGDTDQLPSVGAGNVLKDLIAAAGAPVTRLSVVFRQKGQSPIVGAAHAINTGQTSLPPLFPDVSSVPGWSELAFVQADTPEDCVQKILQLCTAHLPRHAPWLDPVTDVQTLAPMHKGIAGVGQLNLRLQAALNAQQRGLRTPVGELRPGDKIIQLRNNYDKNLFNGDIGVVRKIDPEAGTVDAEFDGDRHTFERGDFGDMALAYCISIHKSQGSEYPVVIIPLLKAHFMMLQRNLLYTALTRGKKKVFFVGEPAAFVMAVRNSEAKERRTYLQPRLAAKK